jgi:hypothetical protein
VLSIADLPRVVKSSDSKDYACSFIGLMVACSISEEEHEYQFGSTVNPGFLDLAVPMNPPNTPFPLKGHLDVDVQVEAADINIALKVQAYGRADCSLWKGESNDAASNLVMVEATARGQATATRSSVNLFGLMCK